MKGERLQCTVQQNQCLLQHGSNLSQVEINTTGQYAANLTVAVSASDTNAGFVLNSSFKIRTTCVCHGG